MNLLLPFLLCTDLPSLQPLQGEERRKWEELQVPQLQACQQMALTQSTCPGEAGRAPGTALGVPTRGVLECERVPALARLWN